MSAFVTGVLSKNYSTRQLLKIVGLQSNNQAEAGTFQKTEKVLFRLGFQKSCSLNSRKAVMTHVIS